MILSPVCLITLVAAMVAVWTLLNTTNALFTLVALGAVIVCCLLGFTFAPLPLRVLIVFTVIGADWLQVSSRS
ncbi:hypothetical protein [Microcoleus sp. FACHB-68]|uniref:hypothetical protein n=1 Tax=Microcoleus sp. FACHB-68 TaxID=2692826 RepID=UPI0016890739|nr:hypothetical protein [Microcoleus sp. FACHB-68]MBD1937327.1 hypothetical protein [Microcoleus sp. FACHB-68]